MTKMNQDKNMGIELRKIQEPSVVHINLEKHPLPNSKLKLGKKIKMVVHGKVASVHQDQYGKTMKMEISHMDHGEDDNGEGDGQ